MRGSDWWALHEALTWMMSNVLSDSPLHGPLSQQEAWRELRAACADGKIRVRGTRHQRKGTNRVWDDIGDGCVIPSEVVQPLWPVGGLDGTLWLANESLVYSLGSLGLLPLDRFPGVYWASVTVSRVDLEREFSRSARYAETPSGAAPKSEGRKPRQPLRQAAAREIFELYEGGVPDQTTVRNAKLCRDVGNLLKQKGITNISDDTILRAAGRRK
jgi:hypothetical protein